MTCCVVLSLALSACAPTERNLVVIAPDVPDSLLVCGDEKTEDGVPVPPAQPYDSRVAAAYVLKLKAYIRECKGNTKAVKKILEEFQTEIAEGNLEAEG